MKFCAACLGIVTAAGLVWGQPPPVEPPTKVLIRPQKEPVPALRYLLLPDVTELHPGNAALNYHRAMLMYRQIRTKPQDANDIYDWAQKPLKDLPKQAVQNVLTRYHNVLHEADLGARSATIDWGLEFRREGFDLLLPEVQEMRALIQLVALQARLNMAEGHFDRAIHALQTGYAMSRHVDQAATTLIETLVGVALTSVMNEQVLTLIQQPNAPNLYWSLTQLPRPFIDIRHGLEGEKGVFFREFPELKRFQQPTLSPAEVNQIVGHVLVRVAGYNIGTGSVEAERAGVVLLTIKFYPQARKWLREQGKTPAQIQAMPPLQAVVLYSVFQYDQLRDNLYKWAYLPYWQALPGLERAGQQLRQAKATMSEGLPFASLLLPALQRVTAAPPRAERQIAALRIIGAIRLYAAAHNDHMPERLDDIHEAPIPLDPVTGKAFKYSRHGETALLVAPQVRGAGTPPALRYELHVAP